MSFSGRSIASQTCLVHDSHSLLASVMSLLAIYPFKAACCSDPNKHVRATDRLDASDVRRARIAKGQLVARRSDFGRSSRMQSVE